MADSKGTASPKSMALRGDLSWSLTSIKLPAEALTSACTCGHDPEKTCAGISMVTWLDISVENVIRMALSQRSQNGSHIAGHLQMPTSKRLAGTPAMSRIACLGWGAQTRTVLSL